MNRIIIAMITLLCGLVGCSSPTTSFGGQANVAYLTVVSPEYNRVKNLRYHVVVNDGTPFAIEIGKDEQFEKTPKYVLPVGKVKIDVYQNGNLVSSGVQMTYVQETVKIKI